MADAGVRYALVTGANRGIGFEICRQLANKGIVVILASRDEKRGVEAQQRLKELNNVVSHQLDVADPASVAAAVEFVKTKFGRLDILVNNAGILGIGVDGDASVLQECIEAAISSISSGDEEVSHTDLKSSGKLIETAKGAEECLETNYYGVKRVTEAFIPLLQLSPSPRIVNVSSLMGTLILQPNSWARGVWSSSDSDGVDQVVQEFLKSFKEGRHREEWPRHLAAYKVSKAALNAYTRVVATKHKDFYVNSVCPGFTKTDLTYNLGFIDDVQGAQSPVKLALLPHGGPTASIFLRDQALAL